MVNADPIFEAYCNKDISNEELSMALLIVKNHENCVTIPRNSNSWDKTPQMGRNQRFTKLFMANFSEEAA
jgi:hypothetical protein